MAVVLVAALVLTGIGVGTYFLTRSLAPGASTDTAAGELRTVRTSVLTFPVPADWEADPEPMPTVVLGVPLEGVTYGPAYECGGNGYFRGVAGAAFLGGELPAGDVAAAFGEETGNSYYTLSDGSPPDVEVGEARPRVVGGVDGQLVEVTSRTAADDGCLATTGTVLVLALPATDLTGAPGTAVLIVNGDVEGGPGSAPPVPARATLEAMIDGARLSGI